MNKQHFKKIFISCLALIFLSLVPSLVPSAFAQSINFEFAAYSLNSGTPTSSIEIIVVDSSANINSSILDTVSISVTSTSQPSGITLVLTETGINTGIFNNTNLVLNNINSQYQITDTVTVSIPDSSQNTNPTAIETISVDVTSSSDLGGITLTLSETDIDTGIFEGTLAFTSSSSSGNTIMVTGGDVVSILYSGTGEFSNGLIIPTSNPGIGFLLADSGDTITATYLGLNDFFTIPSSGPGSGTGGPIRPGLVLDFIAGISGCSLDCVPPTLGITSSGQRLVENGFSYNNNPVNVELFYTPYPLITVKVGEPNIAKLKLYENNGIQNIRHVGLGFGMGKGEIISESKAVIEYDINFDGTTQTSLFDPFNALDNVTVSAQPVKCKSDDQKENCLEVSFNHTFRESLEFNMVGTNVWDIRRNGWQNYFNDGIEVIGNSLNPPKQIKVLDMTGYQKTITLTSKNTGLDEEGNFWHLDGTIWSTDYKIPERDDPITKHGIDRNNNKFSQYMEEQISLAKKTFAEITHYKTIQNPSFGLNNNLQIHPYSNQQIRDKELEQALIFEAEKAEKTFKQLWPELFKK